MKDRIRTILREQARLTVDVDTLADGDDLYRAGLSSLATVNVMLGLEEAFGIEFPDRLLGRGTFASVDAIARAVVSLGVEGKVS